MGCLKKGCCGCSLKGCTLVLGYLSVIGSIIMLIRTGYQVASNKEHFLTVFGLMVRESIPAIVSILMVVGATKERKGLILPWIILAAILIAVLGLGLIEGIMDLPTEIAPNELGEKHMAGVIIFSAVGSFSIFAFVVYLWLIVLSYYVELKLANSQESEISLEMGLSSIPKASYSSTDSVMP